jgi:AsmA protein
MGKPLKILLGLVALLVMLIVVAVIVLPLVIDPNDYKSEIATAVEKQTGRNLTIDGDIELSVFPWLGLDIGPTQLSNAAGFESPYMARMETVQIRVKLLPLLRKQVEIGTVRLTGLQVNLARDATGRTNWEDLQGGEDAATAGGKTAEPDKGPGTGGIEHLAIGGIDVSGARLSWDDRSADAHYEINELSLATGAIGPDEPFDLDLHFQVVATEPALEGQVDLGGTVLLGPGMETLAITDARLELDASGATLPGGQAAVALKTDVAVDLEAQTLSLPVVVLEAFGLTVTGNVAGTQITGDAPQFSGVLEVAEFAPRDLIKALGQEVPVTADSKVLGRADLALTWNASKEHFAARDLQLTLDDTHVSGTAGVRQFAAPAITFALAADELDVDRYLPPPAEESAEAAEAAAAPRGGTPAVAGELPLDALRDLNLDGSLKIGSLKAANIKASAIEIKLTARKGVLQIDPLNALLYQGSVQGNARLNVAQDTPRFAVNETVAGVQAGPLLKDLTGDDKLRGTANLTAKLKGAGSAPEAIKRTLDGTTAFSFTDGSVKGVNIAAVIRNAQAKLKGQAVSTDGQANQTDFTELQGTAKITGGVVSNNDLSMQSPLLRLSGKGEVSLPEETIDYTLMAKIVGSLQGQGGKGLDELKGIAIPVHVGGTFSKPTFAPDLGAALSETAKAKVEEKVEEEKQKIQEKLGDELSDKLLKGLFK